MEKKHTILPKSLKLQLVEKDGTPIEIENILCHLNIYTSSSSCYTYSFIPTNASGAIFLKKEELIASTGLKHWFDNTLILDKAPVKFDLFLIEQEILDYFLSGVKNYLEVKPDAIETDLKKIGFNKSQIEKELPRAIKKQKEDREFFQFVRNNRNSELIYTKVNSKITGFWDEEKDYEYYIECVRKEN